MDTLHPRREICDWDDIRHTYGALAPEMMKLNTPDTITDGIDPARVTDNFDAIKKIITSVPSFADVRAAMETAGCRMTYQDIGKTEAFYREAFLYHPYMRRRLSLRRLLNLTDYADRLPDFDLS